MAYASRALGETEKGWFQIEKELLAVTYAAEHFHYDHKPLETICRKPIQNASPRIPTMLMRLLRYQLHIKYLPGSKLYIVDMLSCAQPSTPPPDDDPCIVEHRIHSLLATHPMSTKRLCQATDEDQILTKLRHLIREGWSDYKRDTDISIRQYWAMRDELHTADKLVFF